jgi:hypothetical protein
LIIGVYEDKYSYPDPYSLQLDGSGAYYTNFAWSTNGMTPGAINHGQSFGLGPVAAIEIQTISCVQTQITITAVFTNTADWMLYALYVARLPPNLQTGDWVAISPLGVETNPYTSTTGLWSIRFAYPTSSFTQSNCFFRVKAVKP